MTEAILPADPNRWRHVPLAKGASEVIESVGLARAADVQATLVWVPVLASGDPLISQEHEAWRLPPPDTAGAISGPPPETEHTLLLQPLASPEDPCFVPFWRVDLGDAVRAWVCGVDGQLLSSTLPAHERRANIRAVVKLTLLVMAASYFVFIGQLITSLAVMVVPVYTPLHLLFHTPVAIGVPLLFAVAFRILVAPAIDEIALERLDPLLLPGPGRAFARAMRGLGVALVLASGITWWGMKDWGPTAPTQITIVLDFALAVVFCGLAFQQTWRPRAYTPTPEVLPRANAETWLRLSKGLSVLLLWGFAAVAVNAVLSALGAYLLPAAGEMNLAWEENAAEAKLVGVGVLIALLRAPLPTESRVTLFVAQAIPLVFEPAVGPAAAATLQLVGVFAAGQLMRQLEGEPVRLDPESVIRALRIEGALLAGALVGQLGGILLVGTSGSTLGDVVGELVAGALMMQWLAAREGAVERGGGAAAHEAGGI